MRLTNQSRQSGNSFPVLQLFLLAICRVGEPIALTSIFPYSFPMIKSFHIGDESNASFYAGILISAFALSEALTGIFWGGVSDRYGRKPVLLLGCFGTLLSLLIVGFSNNFWMALAGRVFGGILNGNVGVIQTMVGELVKKPEHEARAYAVMPFVWSIGTIIGPAIGGTLADPSETFPHMFSKHGLFATFPYLLPNLICGALLLVSIVLGYFFLAETHPDLQPWSTEQDLETSTAETPLLVDAGATADRAVNLKTDAYGTFNQVDLRQDEHWIIDAGASSRPHSLSDKTRATFMTWPVSMLVAALGIFTYHSMTFDHLLPIFLQDDRNDDFTIMTNSMLNIPGGLGLTTQTVGIIMSFDGLIALFIQGVVFPFAANRLGVWRVFILVTMLQPIVYFIVPYLAMLPENLLFPGIYACLTIRNLLSILAYPAMLILLRQASPSPSMLGKINGLAASVGAACRTVGPPVAGLLYGLGTKIGFTGLAWWGSVLVALIGVFQMWFVRRENHASIVQDAPPSMARYVDLEPKKSEGILVTIVECESDEEV